MKQTLLPLLVCLAVASPLALAQVKEDEHSAHHPQGQAAPATSPEAAPGAPASAQPGPTPVEQGMKRLEELMGRIEQQTDPSERANLLHEHMVGMLEQIKLLRSQTAGMKMAMMMMGGGGQMGMMGGDKKKSATKPGTKDKGGGMMCGGMMGEGMMGGGMMGGGMMEKRTEALERLLEQMIRHAHIREAAEH
jgi:hypothetical protein